MTNIFALVLVAAMTAFVSLAGGFLLLVGSRKLATFIQKFGTVFSIGVLLYAISYDLIPEIIELDTLPPVAIVFLAIVGFLLCLTAGFITGHYHKHGDTHAFHSKKQAYAMLIIDSIHTMIDGIAIGVAFAGGIGTGILAATATAAHEIPQEVGDFSIMIRSKMPRKQIAKLQILSALLLIPSALLAYYLGDLATSILPAALSIVVGFFLYIVFGEICSIIKTIRGK